MNEKKEHIIQKCPTLVYGYFSKSIYDGKSYYGKLVSELREN